MSLALFTKKAFQVWQPENKLTSGFFFARKAKKFSKIRRRID
jgi:hypothetical protein